MSSEGRTLTVTATPEWVARSLIQIARRPATPDEDDHLVTIITGYFDQFHAACRASRDAEVEELSSLASCERFRLALSAPGIQKLVEEVK